MSEPTIEGATSRLKAALATPFGVIDWEEAHDDLTVIFGRLQALEGANARLRERLQAIIDWADFAMNNAAEFDSHGVRNLDGPIFDEARQVLAQEQL